MSNLNSSTSWIIYSQKSNSSNYIIQCGFDIALFLRYAGTIIVILGFIGNFLSIFVFSRKSLRSRSCSMYFLALNVSDIWVLVGFTLENLLPNGYGIQLLSSVFMCKFVVFLIYASTDISNYLLTLAAIDRYVLVSFGSAHHRFCRKSTAKSLITVVVLVFSLINSHILFGFHIGQNGSCLPTSTKYAIFYYDHYDSYIDIIKTVLIPFVIIFICNILIISDLARTNNILRRTSTFRRRRRQEKDRQLTGFLLLTSILFIVLSLPSEINDFLRTKFTAEFQMKHACQLLASTTVFILLHQSNHASHFYVYTLTGPIFREEFQKFILSF